MQQCHEATPNGLCERRLELKSATISLFKILDICQGKTVVMVLFMESKKEKKMETGEGM